MHTSTFFQLGYLLGELIGLPEFLGFTERGSALYNPAARIASGPPAERALRRYGLPTR